MLGLVALLAFAPGAAVRADDDEASDDEQSQPSPGSRERSTFVKSAPSPGDIDPLVQSGPGGEHDRRVGVILAAHPDRDVLICLAGCGGGGPKLVAVRNRPAAVVAAAIPAQRELKPASATMVAPGGAAISEHAQPPVGDVICIAGCVGAPGEVVQQAVRLTWIGQGASEDLKSALRGLADRVMAREAAAQVAMRVTGWPHGRRGYRIMPAACWSSRRSPPCWQRWCARRRQWPIAGGPICADPYSTFGQRARWRAS